ncbi:MAG: ABC transporter transmembrane domain-containing protein [Gemmatimonadota bacterium]|nr:ATP-binding cassette domain-containing protein [Gemmatimonadota bacterium]
MQESKRKLTARETLGFIRRVMPRVRPYRRAFWGVALLLPLSTAIGLVFPLIVRGLLDAAFIARDGALLNRVAIGLIVLFAIQSVLNFGQSYLSASVAERVVADLRRDIFNHLVLQSPGWFATRRVGELSSRLASDAGLVQGVIRFGVPEIVRQGVFLVGALVLLTLTHPGLTLITLVAVPFAAVVGWLFGRRVRSISARIQDRLADAIARAEQVFTQIYTVQSYTRERWEIARFQEDVDATRDQGLERAVARAALTGAVTFSASVAIVAVVWQGGRLVLQDALTPGTLVAFLLYVVTIAGAVTSLAGFWANLQEAAGAAGRIFELLDEPRELNDPSAPAPLPAPLEGVVRYQGVWFRYGDDLPFVLRGIDLEVGAGEHVALVGSSGAGKTTMLSLLPRFHDVVGGQVLLDGVDVREFGLADLRGAVGVVPQEPMLFAGTVRENLRYGNLEATDEEVEEAARAAHAHEFIAGFPDGYGQTIGERGVTLSAGQRQRMAIARVMLKRPSVLILDEASASLDSESEALVQDALERLMEGRTTLVIAHRLSTVMRAHRIVVLDGGRIVDEGTHLELLDRSEVYARLYKRQFDQVSGAA